MTLTLYNTLTRRKEPFRPLDPANVRMYVCGPTVYDYAHIGNARPVIVFDVLFRLLRHIYGPEHVTYARNITDVDDKINARAAEEGVPIRDVTERTTRQFHEDIAALGVLPPTIEPRATDHIEDMKRLIEALVAKGCAYVAQDHVLFDVEAMPDYGRLANRSLEEMEAGARVDVAPYKKGPMDFVLWKPSKPGEPSWPSPCGIAAPGRPGWHIECSAMAERHLGQVFDVHGGGIDLVFPHHENELAQSRCAHGTPLMAQVWMHNGFLQVEGEKMSKSLGNFVTIHELLQGWTGEVVRLAMLSTHYRQPINWTAQRLHECKEELWRWAVSLMHSEVEVEGRVRSNLGKGPSPSVQLIRALSDDLNTPDAISVIRNHYEGARAGDASAMSALLQDAEFLGFLRPDKLWLHSPTIIADSPTLVADYYDKAQKAKIFLANGLEEQLKALVEQLQSRGVEAIVHSDGHVELKSSAPTDDKVLKLIEARIAARKAKNFAEADRIRDELAAMGIQLKDSKDPETGDIVTTWEVKR